jgi:hypothetical protein
LIKEIISAAVIRTKLGEVVMSRRLMKRKFEEIES